ncbi:MAG: DUF6778 family protein [Deltaproteobacteria bacterium]
MNFRQLMMVGALALATVTTSLSDAAAKGIRRISIAETADTTAANYEVTKLWVLVPDFLRVSEANNYLPNADIVWRGDPPGDRYKQVDDLVTNAMETGVANMHGAQKVEVVVQISRFHALTERARADVGGYFGIQFYLSVRDPITHQPIRPDVWIDATKEALGGRAAIVQELAGSTQKVIITEHLERMIRAALVASE